MSELFSFLNENKKGEEEAQWRKTSFAIERVKTSGFYEEKGLLRKEKFYQGRPVIGRDTKINGGVYLGGGAREAIVVDDTKYDELNQVFQALIRRRKEAMEQGESFKQSLLGEVWYLVKEVMPFNQEFVEEFLKSLPEPDTKVSLTAYIGEGGVCRHQALLTGYLLERLKREGLVKGQVSVDRNAVKDRGGHAWVRYTNSAGEVFILDPAQDYIGRLAEMDGDNQRWFYERPEDTSRIKNLIIKLRKAVTGK